MEPANLLISERNRHDRSMILSDSLTQAQMEARPLLRIRASDIEQRVSSEDARIKGIKAILKIRQCLSDNLNSLNGRVIVSTKRGKETRNGREYAY